jgi:HAD superfamily hydrolase (TIGR01549 family)
MMIEEAEPLEGARELIVELKQRRHAVVLASSAKQIELDHYLDLLDARGLVEGWTSSEHVKATKPAPDLALASLERSGTDSAVMVGDTTWDAEAAGNAGIDTIAVLTGGFSDRAARTA